MQPIRVLFLLLCSSMLVAHATEAEDVRSAFDDYKSAILSQDGARAAELVSRRTISEYQNYIDWARSAKRETLESLSLINRFQVIIFRHRIPVAELKELDGKGAFIYAVNHDWIGKNGVIRTTLGEVEVSDARATAEVLIGGQKTPGRFQFTKEENRWRLDLISTLRDSGSALQALAQQRNISENELIFILVETVSGRKAPESIWDPKAER